MKVVGVLLIFFVLDARSQFVIDRGERDIFRNLTSCHEERATKDFCYKFNAESSAYDLCTCRCKLDYPMFRNPDVHPVSGGKFESRGTPGCVWHANHRDECFHIRKLKQGNSLNRAALQFDLSRPGYVLTETDLDMEACSRLKTLIKFPQDEDFTLNDDILSAHRVNNTVIRIQWNTKHTKYNGALIRGVFEGCAANIKESYRCFVGKIDGVYNDNCTVKAYDGQCCIFPFTYKNQVYHSCTTVNSNAPWCAVRLHFNNEKQWWQQCADSPKSSSVLTMNVSQTSLFSLPFLTTTYQSLSSHPPPTIVIKPTLSSTHHTLPSSDTTSQMSTGYNSIRSNLTSDTPSTFVTYLQPSEITVKISTYMPTSRSSWLLIPSEDPISLSYKSIQSLQTTLKSMSPDSLSVRTEKLSPNSSQKLLPSSHSFGVMSKFREPSATLSVSNSSFHEAGKLFATSSFIKTAVPSQLSVKQTQTIIQVPTVITSSSISPDEYLSRSLSPTLNNVSIPSVREINKTDTASILTSISHSKSHPPYSSSHIPSHSSKAHSFVMKSSLVKENNKTNSTGTTSSKSNNETDLPVFLRSLIPSHNYSTRVHSSSFTKIKLSSTETFISYKITSTPSLISVDSTTSEGSLSYVPRPSLAKPSQEMSSFVMARSVRNSSVVMSQTYSQTSQVSEKSTIEPSSSVSHSRVYGFDSKSTGLVLLTASSSFLTNNTYSFSYSLSKNNQDSVLSSTSTLATTTLILVSNSTSSMSYNLSTASQETVAISDENSTILSTINISDRTNITNTVSSALPSLLVHSPNIINTSTYTRFISSLSETFISSLGVSSQNISNFIHPTFKTIDPGINGHKPTNGSVPNGTPNNQREILITKIILIAAITAGMLLLILLFFCVCLCIKKRRRTAIKEKTSMGMDGHYITPPPDRDVNQSEHIYENEDAKDEQNDHYYNAEAETEFNNQTNDENKESPPKPSYLSFKI